MKIDGETLAAHQRIAERADPLHFGTWGGLPSKIAWFLFGCLLTGLAVTGVIIYATRLHGSWRVAMIGVSWWGLGGVSLAALASWLSRSGRPICCWL